MNRSPVQTVFLVGLALVFTIGLSFASVELPYLVDEAVQNSVPTPDIDSQVDEVSRLKTELFISHYHLRAMGYLCLGAILVLIGLGFATRRSGFAALGALAFMLPVFAQFAGVMFFLAGLGLLNVVWLPVLDISFGLSGLGAVIRAPFDALRWVLGLFGVNGYWPLVYFFIGSGLLIFFLGTLAWLQTRARKEGVAVSWVYRISRHPQYLGWIIWSYGIYLLLLQARYPKRSWGISANLPWLVSTVAIIGVAMVEELNMRREHGEKYEAYRRSAPFLFPAPAFVERLFAIPFRVMFGKARPERRREVVAVLSLYTALLMGLSSLFYGGGLDRIRNAFRSNQSREEFRVGLVAEIRAEENWRRQSALTRSFGPMGEEGVESLVELLQDENPEIREFAAETLTEFPSEAAFEALDLALKDSSEDVRWRASQAVGALGTAESATSLLSVLDDPASHIRIDALHSLARFGAEEVISPALEMTRADSFRERADGVRILGALGSPAGLPVVMECLTDDESWVRAEAVIALLRIGSLEGAPALEMVLDDEDREVRLYATETLKRLREG